MAGVAPLAVTLFIVLTERERNGAVSVEQRQAVWRSELLGYAKSQLLAMIARRGIKSAVFIPYALIRYDYDQRAQELAQTLGIEVTSIHHAASPAAAIAQAECIWSAAAIPGC